MRKQTGIVLSVVATLAFLTFLLVFSLCFLPEENYSVVPQLSCASQQSVYPVNLNTADREMLQRLPGIGPSLAEAILAYRNENGSFQSISELAEVPGIGEKRYEDVRTLIFVEGEA